MSSSDPSASSSPLIPHGILPAYLANCFGDIYEEDGICVFGKGLGWLELLATLCRFYADTTDDGHVALVEQNQQEEDELEEKVRRGQHKNPNPKSAAAAATSQQKRKRRHQRRPPLVLVLGLTDQDHAVLLALLESWGTPHEMLPKIITNESGQSKDRQSIYARGGVFCVTSRILIVDFLTSTIQSKDVDGLLIGHAHQVTNDSTEAFIVRIYTTQKRRDKCFIKAFSDSPDRLVQGFANTDKVLKALQVQNLYLYPRFHSSIQDELRGGGGNSYQRQRQHPQDPQQRQPVPPVLVEELQIGLTPRMKEIQSAIVTAVKTCMKELKNSTPQVEWNYGNDDLRIENCVTSQFDRAISNQLEKDWHRLKPDTKQLVQDLRTLRNLFQYLVQYDCVSFWKLINTIKTISSSGPSSSSSGGGSSSRNQALWLLTPAAQVLFQRAKERLYIIEEDVQEKGETNRTSRSTTKTKTTNGNYTAPDNDNHNTNPVSKLRPILEENPKWGLLRKVVTEAVEDANQKKRTSTILVVVKDERTVDFMRSYLIEGRDRTLAMRWLKYLEQYNDRARSVAGSKISEESRLLLEEESRVRRILYGDRKRRAMKTNNQRGSSTSSSTAKPGPKKRGRGNAKNSNAGRKLNQVPDYVKKRRRIELEKGRGGDMTNTSEDVQRNAALTVALEQTEHDLNDWRKDTRADTDDEESDSDRSNSDEIYDSMFQASFIEDEDEHKIIIKSLKSMEGAAAGMELADLDPDYVILYDYDIGFVRSVEVHGALRAAADGRQLKVYFLYFMASSEQKVFVKSLEREKKAFEKLIFHKKHMPPPVLLVEGTQEMQQALATGSLGGTYANGRLPLAMDTRRAGGRNSKHKEKRDIAVDVREFRSALPSILHRGGMRLAPVTLTVGDFVLSNVHCVERKSISDLFGSFASGRLYTQAESMSKYYACPILLIEFDPSKAFCLTSEKDLGMDIRTDSVCSKIAILTMHFPKLRILWSKSPHETLRIFKELKQNHEEVNVAKAVEIGRNETDEALLRPDESKGAGDDGDENDEDEINEAARDMLLRLPGMTIASARKIMYECECDTLADVIKLSRDDLRRIMGPSKGQKLFTFLSQTFGSI